jgi:hypothetical protein
MNNITFIINDYNKQRLGIGNILKCLISALSINDDTIIQTYNDYIYGNYDTILDDKFIYNEKNNYKQLERVYTCRLLIHKNEEDLQEDLINEEWWLNGLENPKFHHLFSFSKRIDWYYDTNKIHPIIKIRIFNTIDKIQFKPVILQERDTIYDSFKNDTTLGLSIRTWKASHEQDINRAYSFETYVAKINEVLDKHPNINKIVISIDNSDYINEYIEYFKSKNLSCLILNKNEHINDIQYAIIKVLILAKCNYFIGNRISTFSELVFWFSKHQTQVYTVF